MPSEKGSSESMTVLEAGTRNLIVTYPDESLHEAFAEILRNNIGRLPVVDRGNPGHVIEILDGRASWPRDWGDLGSETCAGTGLESKEAGDECY